jgi:hypothetical protein
MQSLCTDKLKAIARRLERQLSTEELFLEVALEDIIAAAVIGKIADRQGELGTTHS